MSGSPLEDIDAIKAQAHIHHAYLLGLQLMVATNRSNEEVGDWMFRLFRRQHLDKFLSSFEKLGLDGLPDADDGTGPSENCRSFGDGGRIWHIGRGAKLAGV